MGRAKGIHTKQLTEQQHTQIRTLFFTGGLTKDQIYQRLRNVGQSVSHGQIRRALETEKPRHQDRGRHAGLNDEKFQKLEEYVVHSKEGRRASWEALAAMSLTLLGCAIGWIAIRNAFYRHGYRRFHARRKPPITETNRRKRLAWAREHEHWTIDQWRNVLWTDETWVTGGHHRRVWVTRRPGEEFNENCIVERHVRKSGWMFWGSFCGIGLNGLLKGPAFFWEKDWGSIGEDTYREHTIPVIDEWIRAARAQGHEILFMQDNAPGHKAAGTTADLRARGITILEWPPFSPDLNPIESVWNKMKDYIQIHHGLVEKPSRTQLRQWTREAWDAVEEEYLEDLLQSMPQRCRDVIDANGMHTKW